MTYPELRQPVSLDHLERMTDCLGLIQHANYMRALVEKGLVTTETMVAQPPEEFLK
jgi:hypothetical protein